MSSMTISYLTKPIYSGVPQGSILCPLLFKLYINDIVLSSNVFKCIMHADDTTLFTTINTFNEYQLAAGIITELVKVNEWLIVNKLSNKTKAMVFQMAQKCNTCIQSSANKTTYGDC